MIERALGGAHFAASHVRIHSRRGEASMPQQKLDGPQIGAGFEQMGGETVPE